MNLSIQKLGVSSRHGSLPFFQIILHKIFCFIHGILSIVKEGLFIVGGKKITECCAGS